MDLPGCTPSAPTSQASPRRDTCGRDLGPLCVLHKGYGSGNLHRTSPTGRTFACTVRTCVAAGSGSPRGSSIGTCRGRSQLSMEDTPWPHRSQTSDVRRHIRPWSSTWRYAWCAPACLGRRMHSPSLRSGSAHKPTPRFTDSISVPGTRRPSRDVNHCAAACCGVIRASVMH